MVRLAKVVELALDDLGLTVNQYRALTLVAAGAPSMREFAVRLAMQIPNVSTLIDGLVERLGVLAEAGRSSQHAHTLVVGELHAWLDWFEGWLRGRLGPGPTDLQVATLAATTMAAAEAAMRVWARGAASRTRSTAGPTFHEVLAEALGHLRPTLDALTASR